MEDKLEFPNKEPTRYDSERLKVGLKYESSEHIAWRVEKQHYDNFNSVSKSQRDEILRCFKAGGITIGEVAKKFELSGKVVGDIIFLNIDKKIMHTLREESL